MRRPCACDDRRREQRTTQARGAARNNAGSVETTEEDKRKLAAESLTYNLSKPAWRDMFPQLEEAAAAAGMAVPQLPPQVRVSRVWLATEGGLVSDFF